jgi:hypothetical protein
MFHILSHPEMFICAGQRGGKMVEQRSWFTYKEMRMANRKPTAKEIRRDADRLLRQQREVLAEAATVLRAAGREAGRYAHDDLYPRFSEGTRHAARSARDRLVGDVIPSIASVVGSTMSVVDAARGRQSLLGRALKSVPNRTAPVAAKAGAGKYIAVGLGLAVALGVGYVIYQTFRADDELWVEEDLD